MKFDINWICRRYLFAIRLMLFILLFIYAFDCVRDALGRVHADDPMCMWVTTTDSVKGISHTVNSTIVDCGTVLVRFCQTSDPKLLAVPMCAEHGVEIPLGTDRSIYDTWNEYFLGGAIRLPPDCLDNFLAKLP